MFGCLLFITFVRFIFASKMKYSSYANTSVFFVKIQSSGLNIAHDLMSYWDYFLNYTTINIATHIFILVVKSDFIIKSILKFIHI